MNGAEMIECGNLMAQEHRTVTEHARMLELQRRAKLELPHDDPSTPGVDEGETEIVRKMRVDGEWQVRLVAVEKQLEAIGKAVIGAAAAELPDLLAGVFRK